MKNADPGSSRMRAVLVVYASRRGASLFGLFRCPGTTSMTARSHRRKLAFGCPAGRDVVGGAISGGRDCQERPAASAGTGTSNPCAACMLADDPEVVLRVPADLTGHQIEHGR